MTVIVGVDMAKVGQDRCATAVYVDRLPLTDLQRYCLVACYSDGASSEEVGERIGKTSAAVRMILRRASNRLAAVGLPRPMPYGRGFRAEFRRALPMVGN